MSSTRVAAPLRYDPSFETPPADEVQTTAQLTETMRGISETTFKDSGHAFRSVHAKSHGLLRGELRVLDGLPPELAQGVFARAATYPVVMRFSTNPGDILDDSVSAPRGLAIKIVGVEGERLPGSEGAVTQDFLMLDSPAFAAPDPKGFLKTLKLLASTTDRAQPVKKAASAALRGTERALEAVGGESATLKNLGGQPATHILGETFFTTVPFLHGPYMAKLSLAPASPELKSLSGTSVSLAGKPNGLRDAITEFFNAREGEWELRVQLCTNAQKMPIEDASVPWPEDESPYVAVARISVPRQPAWTEARAAAVDDGLAFSSWHGLAAHRPIGGINRARKPVYETMTGVRSAQNHHPIHEPRDLETLPA